MKRPGTAIFFLILVGVLAYLFVPRVVHLEELKKRNRNMVGELKRLQKENAMLENEIKLLTQDPVYIEKIARSKFKKARENEIVYKIVQEEPAQQ